MTKSVESLQSRLLNVAREQNLVYQDLLNRLGAEQFLYRLSISEFSKKFVFKGGFLLTYLIGSARRTRDLDFSTARLGSQVDETVSIVRSICEIAVDDFLSWTDVSGVSLNHPDMDEPGVRINSHFLFGKMKGAIQIDVASANQLELVNKRLTRLQYKGEQFFSGDIILQTYALEVVFAEKLATAVKKDSQNTRMKDYYDMFRLCSGNLDRTKLLASLQSVFEERKIGRIITLDFDSNQVESLDVYWKHFLKRDNLTDAPRSIGDVIERINRFVEGSK